MTASPKRGERGALALEMVLLTPVLLACILVIAAGARLVDARGQVIHAASVAARAASLEANRTDARAAGLEAARAALLETGQSCRDLRVDLDASRFVPGGVIRAHVRCRVDLSDLAGFGLPGGHTFDGEAVVPVERHRVIT